MNETEIQRIAAAVNQLRPDWPAKSLETLIATRLAERPRRDVAVALTWVACDSATLTPARVVEAGPWWKAAAVEEPETLVRRNPKPEETCGDHPGEYRLSCRLHAADRKAAREAERTHAAIDHAMTRDEARAFLRAATKATRAREARQQTARDAAQPEETGT